MATSTITVAGMDPALKILGPTQQLNYNQVLSTLQVNNSFIPTSLISSQTNFEFRNNLLSGFRWIHTTNNTDTYGSLVLTSFVNASSSGTNLINFSSSGIVLGSGTFVGIGKNLPAYLLHLGTDNSSIPLIYMASTSIPSTPGAANDGIFSVSSGKPIFTSGTTKYQGTIVTAITTGSAATAGIGNLNGTTGVTITTTAVTTTSIINITRNNGTSGAPLASSLGNLSIGSITANTSFIVYSTNSLDTFGFNWQIINP